MSKAEDPFKDLFMQFLRDKKTAVKSVAEDLERMQALNRGLATFLENIDEAEMSDANVRQKLRTLMKVLKTQNSIMTKTMVLMLAYIQGTSFDKDVANMLAQLGYGEEALKAMMDSKLKGDY